MSLPVLSALDAAARRTMGVLGRTNVGTNIDAITEDGRHQVAANTPTAPTDRAGWVDHYEIAGAGATARQVFHARGGLEMWVRLRATDGTWGQWYVLWTAYSGLITVAMSGGVPIGGIMDRGAGTNGEFVRFMDGTMFCWRTGLDLTYSSATALVATWTYPALFVNNTVFATLAISSTSGDYTGVSFASPTEPKANPGSASCPFLAIKQDTGSWASNAKIAGNRAFASGRWSNAA